MAHVELRRGGTCITLSKEDLEVRYIQYKICHGLIFSFLDIQNCFRFLLKSQCPIWLIRGEDNRAVFPKSNGRFVDDASHYEVAGEPVDAFKPATSVPASPFGGYAKPPTFTSTPTSFVAPNGVQKGKAKAFHKTIVVIALETFDPKRPCSSKMASNFNYSVVTQIVVLLDETKCDVPFVTEQVSKQLGFEAILLDSKCYVIRQSDSTKGIDFWKSNRKIMATSKQAYENINSPDVSAASVLPRKRASSMDEELHSKMSKVIDNLDWIGNVSHFFEESFHCVICKEIATNPVVSSCCGRVVGCKVCIDAWVREKLNCPHCTLSSKIKDRFVLRGFDDVLSVLRSFSRRISIDDYDPFDDQPRSPPFAYTYSPHDSDGL